jgi:NAD(P)H-dependent FMN reductase
VNVLGIIGSPRREQGRSHEIVSAILAGAETAGAATELLYLIDEEPQYCIHCGHDCFGEGDCAQEAAATLRSQRVGAADALVLCAPVYCWQPNGLTATLFDKVRLTSKPWNRGTPNGRPALGIALAGGTGTGVFPALQSIYAWLCLWKFRPLEPLPLTRFNMDRALARADELGVALAAQEARPFASTAELMVTYDRLPYMGYGRVDEFRWLAQQILAGLRTRAAAADVAETVSQLLAQAETRAAEGDALGEMQHILDAYLNGRTAW